MKIVLKGIVGLAVIGYMIFNNIPRYHEFDQGVFSLEPGEYYYYEITSTGKTKLQVVLNEASSQTFDAYLLNDESYQKFVSWMESEDLDQPEIASLKYWEGVSQVDQKDISVGAGSIHLVVDNTVLGTLGETSLSVDYTLFEEY